MRNPNVRPVRAFVLVAIAALVVSTSATAEPSIGAKQAEAQRVMAEIQQIDAEVGRAAEAYNLANLKLERIDRERAENRQRLGLAKTNLRHAQKTLRARLVALYTADAAADSTLEILLGARSLDDLLTRVDAIDRVSQLDARVLHEVRAFRDAVRKHEVELRRARAEQVQLIAARAAQKAAIEQKLAQRQSLLTSIKDEIARIQARERARSLAIARQLQAQRAAAAAAASEAAAAPREAAAAPAPPSASAPAAAEPSLGVSAATPEGVSVAPPARHGGVVGIAMQYLGIPYKWGGSSPSTGFDCSGFVMFVYSQVGVSLPHNAAAQYGVGTPVAKGELQPGDLVFFNGLGHNGIYIGGGNFIHSPHTGDVVKISSLGQDWYARTWVGARRL